MLNPQDPTDRPRRVLVFGSFGPSLEMFRGSLISRIVAAGYELHAMAGDMDDDTAARLEARGAHVHAVSIARTSMAPLAFLGLMLRLARAVRGIDPDVIIAYTIKPVVLGALVNRRARFVAVITGLGYAFTGGRELKRRTALLAARALYAAALMKADVVLFQNPDDLADFCRAGALPRGANTALVAGSGVELDKFAPVALPARPRFLMASRFLRDKGIREFAAAAAAVRRECPEASVALAGFLDASPDSIGADEFTAMIAGGIEDLGHLDDIRPAIGACTVYVLPSYREGTPRSVLEAMAMGRAIITTDAPGCRETVIHGLNGLLVPPRDAGALTAAMLELARDPARVERMGAQSRLMAERKFDVRLVNDAIMQHAGLC